MSVIQSFNLFIRLPSLVEYTKDPILKGLKDYSSYVRKAAAIGCLQLYQLAPKEMIGSLNVHVLLIWKSVKIFWSECSV